MDFFGRYAIPASPEIVWAALNDPEILKACIPGCEAMTKTDDSHFETAVVFKIGPVKATFKGRVTLENPDPPRSVRLIGEGQGGVAGFAKGHADIALSPDGHGTVLACTAKASLGGKLAQAGQKLIGGAAKQIKAVITAGHIATPAAPTRSGYTFACWFQDSACTIPWDFSTATITGDITVYAGWN